MTIPSGAAAVNPNLKFGVSRNISSVNQRTQGNVVSVLREEKYPNSVPQNWEGKKIASTQTEGIDGSKITTGTISGARTPGIGEIRDALCQGYYGTLTVGYTPAQLKTMMQALVARIDALEP